MSPQRTEWTKWIRLSLAGVLYDWQAYPDQTKAVKGQNSKTLVTTGTIKALAVPCMRIGKTGDFLQRKRKSRVRGKEKRLERKQREKERKLKKRKERVSLKEHAPIGRLPSLPLQKSHLSSKECKTRTFQVGL